MFRHRGSVVCRLQDLGAGEENLSCPAAGGEYLRTWASGSATGGLAGVDAFCEAISDEGAAFAM
jgi:hypothetical protein